MRDNKKPGFASDGGNDDGLVKRMVDNDVL